LDRWEAFVGGDYSFGRCDLNATAASQPPYSDGVWLDWGTAGKGVSSASADFTLNLSGRGAEVDWSFAENMTTTALISGSYETIGPGQNRKRVTVILNLLNEGEPALTGSISILYMKGGKWWDPTILGSYSRQDFGNGTYQFTFEDNIPSNLVRVHADVYDRRDVFVQAEASLSEG